MALVDPEISRTKLRREMEQWRGIGIHKERGCLLLEYSDEKLLVELGFVAKLSTSSGSAPLPAVVCAVRLSYDNYDLWPPSLTFIDFFTREASRPHVRAFQATPNGPQDVLVDAHPQTLQPFLCVPGIREYHSHPQHTGDSWLLYRSRGDGSVSTICERLWLFMAKNVIGLKVQLQALPTWPLQAQLNISIAQGTIELSPAEPSLRKIEPPNDSDGAAATAEPQGLAPIAAH